MFAHTIVSSCFFFFQPLNPLTLITSCLSSAGVRRMAFSTGSAATRGDHTGVRVVGSIWSAVSTLSELRTWFDGEHPRRPGPTKLRKVRSATKNVLVIPACVLCTVQMVHRCRSHEGVQYNCSTHHILSLSLMIHFVWTYSIWVQRCACCLLFVFELKKCLPGKKSASLTVLYPTQQVK